MAADNLIDGQISYNQCEKAVNALLKHVTKIAKQKEEKELLPEREENVWLTFSVKKVTPEKKLKPRRIPLVHPIVDPRVLPVCLITKDPQREYKDLLEANNVKFINRVVGVTKLKGKFKALEARRMLMKENGLFLADDRVIPLLPKLLGKIFFNAKKQPIPVSLTKKDVKSELESAINSTYMHQNQGTCTSIKIGTIAHSPKQILDNLRVALPAIAKHVEGGWDNVQSFHIKTTSSISLPIWSCELGDDGRWKESSKEISASVDEKSGVDTRKEKSKEKAEEIEAGSSSEAEEAPVSSKKSKKRAAATEAKSQNKKAKTKKDEPPPVTEEPQPKPISSKSVSKDGAKKKSDAAVPKPKKAQSEKKSASKKVASDRDAPVPTAQPELASNKEDKPVSVPKIEHKPEELKKKRAEEVVQKKKEKMAKSKGATGTVKEQILGRKAKSRI